jgi:hypothetical protein
MSMEFVKKEPLPLVWKSECMNSKIDIVEVVRCKDCIYHNSEPDSQGDYCDKIHWSRGLNWYCGDGKRR